MTPMYRRTLALLLVSLVMAGGGAFLRATVDRTSGQSEYASNISKNLDGWICIEERGPLAEEVKVLGTEDIISRIYVARDGGMCFLSVVRSPNKRTGVHDPLVCMKAQGWETMQKRSTSLPLSDDESVPAMEAVVMHTTGVSRLTLFYYKTGPYYTNDYWHQQLQVFWNQLMHRGTQSSSSLLRMETDFDHTREGELDAARARLKEFANLILPEVVKHIP